ncbi:Hsp70 family protein [Geodermatophilus sabuli]|uniref:Hsp70 protein n=1 Tax=Geodermatophilus sabuli TaxID=1564158 RepID=A0A285EEB2_9ACTN|nr:Hsp70 family protein [Geodermatophilus sabuli]MBB3086327.1 hypothetical protein [Geodermatophilus sabuli]SNX97458.1 Hsp70 protein [Geodermatophilus sabuli]
MREPGKVMANQGAPVRDDEYGLGIDIGDGTISAAVCAKDGTGQAAAEPVRFGGQGPTLPAGVAVGPDGGVTLTPTPEAVTVSHVMARVGAPEPVYAGQRPVAAADLAAGAVQRVREAAARQEGRPDAWTVVTVPPSWGRHRRAVFARALEAAGVPRFSLVSSAVAAVHHHVVTGDLAPEPTVAVYDLGASTLDTAVVGPTAEEPLGHRGLPPEPRAWGGRDVDDVVLAHVLASGATPIAGGHALRAACTAAKEALSARTTVDVAAGLPDGPVRLTREELDEALTGPVQESLTAVADAVAAAGLEPADLDAVVLAGGGVRVPLVAEILSGELDRPLVVCPEPALTAALGAAALAADALVAEELLAAVPPPAAPASTGVVPAGTAPSGDVPAPRADRRPPAERGSSSRRPGGTTRPRRSSRARRGAVVGGALLGLLVVPPTLAAVLASDPAATQGAEQTAGRDGGQVIATGTAGVGGTAPAGTAAQPATTPGSRAGTAGGGTGGGAAGTQPRTSLAAAITTAARSGGVSAGATSSAPGTTGSRPASGVVPPGTVPGTTDPGTTSSGTTSSGSAAPGTTRPGTTAPGTPAPGSTPPGTTAPQPTTPAPEPTTPPVTTPPDPTTPPSEPTTPPADPTTSPDPTTPAAEPEQTTPAPPPTTPPAPAPEPEPLPGPASATELL